MRSEILKTLLILVAFLSSCSDWYEEDIANVLQHKENEKTIAISGIITSEYSKQTIVVSRSIDFMELYVSSGGDSKKIKDTLTHRRVGGAKVYVEVAGKKYEFKEMHKTGHLYEPPKGNDWPKEILYDKIYYESIDSFAGIPNQEHKLVVDVEGKTYTATDVMPQVSEIIFNEKSPLCRLISDRLDEFDTATNYPNYLFGQQEAYIMGFYTITDSDDGVYGFSDPCYSFRQLASPQLMGELNDLVISVCYSNYDYRYSPHFTDSIVVSKMSCSPAYEYFLYCLFQAKQANGYDFGDVSSAIPTNISNGGVGFFAACDLKRKIYNRWDLVHLAESIGNIIEY